MKKALSLTEQKQFLHGVLESRDYTVLDRFCTNGGNINVKLNPPKQTLLALAVEKDLLSLIERSISCGADVNCADLSGTTPIFAVQSIAAAQLLINNGADLTVKNKKDKDVLYFHISSHRTDVVKYLTHEMGERWDASTLHHIQPMEETTFWGIIENAYRANKGDEQLQAGSIVRVLQFENPQTIIAFQKRCYQVVSYAHTSNVWAAAFIINNGCSDDTFTDFKYWLLSLGEKAFFACIENPDKMLPYLQAKNNFANYTNITCESIAYAAETAYRYRTGLDNFWDTVDYTKVENVFNEPLLLDWDEHTIEKKKDVFPKLWAMYRREGGL